MSLLFEDAGYFDLTTHGLGIGNKMGTMKYAPKQKIVLCGVDEAKKVFDELGLKYVFFKHNGEVVEAKESIVLCEGEAEKLHKAWKIVQNIFEYMSGISTYTNQLLSLAREINPNISISTTRKNLPSAKELMLKAVMCGGGVPHRLGLYDTILVFAQHLEFFKTKDELESGFKNLKESFVEKKVTVEVENFGEAEYFASLGADILQCEKMNYEELSRCTTLKQNYPNLLLSATGGINHSNIQEYVKCGVDLIVTSSPYHAKPLDVKVSMEPL
ncbi:MAG: ModD protein [Sulfurimonas sp.]|jgi:molybdenum transport protein|nr:ModD protein [Sulfurimonadaceae bacterium]